MVSNISIVRQHIYYNACSAMRMQTSLLFIFEISKAIETIYIHTQIHLVYKVYLLTNVPPPRLRRFSKLIGYEMRLNENVTILIRKCKIGMKSSTKYPHILPSKN